ncbi:MAG: dihydroorotate dehydrogenase electron transfer subunit [Lachnospiraceae bacterium]
MAETKKEQGMILSQEQIASEVYSMWIKTSIAVDARPGQFISVYTKTDSRLLPRPISICEMREDALRIVYRKAGKGTEEFAGYQKGDRISILGPLGNGFPLKEAPSLLVGGGIGIPPMLALAKQLSCEKEIIVGYRDELFLQEELAEYGRVTVATEDGSAGIKGNVIDAIKKKGLSAKVLYACGPTPMLRGLKQYAAENGMEAWLSLEERMACGVGACLGCVCRSKEQDSHSLVHNKRICKDGPVFLAEEVEL